MKRSPLKIHDWPADDKEMWHALVRGGDVLTESGPGAHWRSSTQSILVRDYGYWLAHFNDIGVPLEAEPAINRITRDRVQSYVAATEDLAFSTRAARLTALLVIARRAAPSNDWSWLQRIHSWLDAEARSDRGTRKQNRIFASHKLLAAGLQHMTEAQRGSFDEPWKRAIKFRDGLVIALLALRPLRILNFAGLRIGRHIVSVGSHYQIIIPEDEMKCGRPFETMLPAELVPYYEEYVSVHRPKLLRAARSDRLWINRRGRPYSPKHLSMRVSLLTSRLLGIAVSPHLFRDAAATTIATADPSHVGVIAPLLGHASPSTAERYYKQARTLEAGRAHQENIRQFRKSLSRRV